MSTTISQQWERAQLEKDFLKYMGELSAAGVPATIMDDFAKQKDELLAKLAKMYIPSDHIPFLPVITLGRMGLKSQVKLINHRFNHTAGSEPPLMDRGNFREAAVPPTVYFILDVENGKRTMGREHEEAVRAIEAEGRLCLTGAEAASLGLLTDALTDHAIVAPACRFLPSRIGVVDEACGRNGLAERIPFMFGLHLARRTWRFPAPTSAPASTLNSAQTLDEILNGAFDALRVRELEDKEVVVKIPEGTWVYGEGKGEKWGTPSCVARVSFLEPRVRRLSQEGWKEDEGIVIP